MNAELTARPQGAARHPWDWYVEEKWVTHRLVDMLGLQRDGVTYLDPCCGQLHIPEALAECGLTAFGTDLFDRTGGKHPLFLGTHDFLGLQHHILEAAGPVSIIMNPPFSYQDGRLVRGLAEKFIRRALSIATNQVCALLPLKWLASAGRFRLFSQHTPAGVWILSERPSMPPGDMIAHLAGRAYSHGKVDYVWVVWDRLAEPTRDALGRSFAPTYWIPPREKTPAQPLLALAA